MAEKKTLYDALGVSQYASDTDIRAAYQAMLRAIQSELADSSGADTRQKLQIIKLAFTTLTSPASRAAYDTQLDARRAPAKLPELSLEPLSASLTAAEMGHVHSVPGYTSTRSRDLAHPAEGPRTRDPEWTPPPREPAVTVGVYQSETVRGVLKWMGIVALGWVVVKLGTLFMYGYILSNDQSRRAAEDKARLQEYYQTHGVRPANMAELQQMEAARREEAEELQRKRSAEMANQHFEEDSRRRGEEVSQQLQYDEQSAQRQAAREERQAEMERMRREASERQAREREERRLEAERARWREINNAPYSR